MFSLNYYFLEFEEIVNSFMSFKYFNYMIDNYYIPAFPPLMEDKCHFCTKMIEAKDKS